MGKILMLHDSAQRAGLKKPDIKSASELSTADYLKMVEEVLSKGGENAARLDGFVRGMHAALKATGKLK